ncbi:MAG: NAD(P)H-binding protein [Bacteroidetes bacterium]|jgi:uncharacterized protein YbjT (DUF2867 family)|nr:NAD(P)H-binding protein [Bacteroidota bacterium]
MKRVLITGATGNVGFEVIRFLYQNHPDVQIIAAARNEKQARRVLVDYPKLQFVTFDFEHEAGFDAALEKVDCVYLLRPPHISDIPGYIAPFINKMKAKNICKIVFLSVQGAEKSKVIPHNKIERLILASGMDYVFIRPAYFMQNLTTTLMNDIKHKRKIILPAGKSKFNWIDVANIGEVSAIILDRFDQFRNQKMEVTGYENEDFYYVAHTINRFIPDQVTYKNINPLRFYFLKKKENIPAGKIMVMIMLHYLPRFQQEPAISSFYEQLTGKKPTTLAAFVEREKEKFKPAKKT